MQYLGIAVDEPERIKRHSVPGKMLPLVDIGWDEAYCRQWCEENDLLSPIYTTATRGGCWFCHNQSVDQRISGGYALGAGISKAFDANYNMRFKLPRDFAISEGDKFANVGRALLVDNAFNLVTKQRCFHEPTYDTFYQALEDMREQCENFNIDKLAMSLIGCCLSQFEWDKVKDVIEDVFGDTDIEILICRL